MRRYSFFLHAFLSGGAELVMVNIANRLAQRGEAVDIVVGHPDGPVRELVSADVRVVDLNCDRTYKAILPLARYLRRERPIALLTSVIHANIAVSIAHFLARSSARLILREANPEHKQDQSFSVFKGWILKKLAYWAYRRATVIVSVSKALEKIIRDDLSISDPSSIKVIYNPIAANFDELANEPTDVAFDDEKPLPVVVGVGRLVDVKGFPILIQAIARLKATHPVRLIIAGQGDELANLQSLALQLGISDRVSFPGHVANPLPLMKQASVFVLSSYREGMPNALIEAIACGTPVVATDCPTGPREVLDDGRFGTLVPVGDVETMAAAIADVLDGNTPVFDRDQCIEKFEADTIVDQYMTVMNPDSLEVNRR